MRNTCSIPVGLHVLRKILSRMEREGVRTAIVIRDDAAALILSTRGRVTIVSNAEKSYVKEILSGEDRVIVYIAGRTDYPVEAPAPLVSAALIVSASYEAAAELLQNLST
jgi:hypothetical protein